MTDAVVEGMSKAQLLAADEREFARLDSLLEPLSAAQLTAPTSEGGWSVKDHLAHLAAWLTNTSQRIERQGVGDLDAIPDDEINEMLYQRDKGRPFTEVLANLRASRDRLRALVSPLTDVAVITPDYYPWCNGRPLIDSLAGNMHEHYQEHLADLQSYLAGLKGELV